MITKNGLLYFAVLYSFWCKHARGNEDSTFPPPPHFSSDENPAGLTASIAEALQLSGYQCSLGDNLSIPLIDSEVALSGKLYVEFGKVAPCSGTVTRWEACFVRSGLLGPMPTRSVHFVVLRHNQSQTSYSIVNIREIILMHTGSGLQCNYINAGGNGIAMEQGDVLGFVNGMNVKVALRVLPGNVNSTLKVFNFGMMRRDPPATHNSVVQGLQINTSIGLDEFEESTQQVTSLIRVIISECSVLPRNF